MCIDSVISKIKMVIVYHGFDHNTIEIVAVASLELMIYDDYIIFITSMNLVMNLFN